MERTSSRTAKAIDSMHMIDCLSSFRSSDGSSRRFVGPRPACSTRGVGRAAPVPSRLRTRRRVPPPVRSEVTAERPV